MGITYRDAGVDIQKGEEAVNRIKSHVSATFSSNVLTTLGSFGAAYRFPIEQFRHPVLVSSTDGVGTKLKIAFLTGIHDTVGQDLVNHCVNDILTTGAIPLFFLDYIATGKLKPDVVEAIIQGLARACQENGCSLIGGEMAEMPDFYKSDEYDVCGTITGVVEQENLITSTRIQKGDVLIGLSSSGLHTNGYTLARKVLLRQFHLDQYLEELGCTLGEELLKIHRSYLNILKDYLNDESLHGISHITGGGIIGNTTRLLPSGYKLKIYWDSWECPPIFKLIQEAARISNAEMQKVFNLGIGMILIVEQGSVEKWRQRLFDKGEKAYIIGEII